MIERPFALVLSGGGVTGVAWETAFLKGLRDAGVDLTSADLIIGTSAGSIVGTQIASGIDLDTLCTRQLQGEPADGEGATLVRRCKTSTSGFWGLPVKQGSGIEWMQHADGEGR